MEETKCEAPTKASVGSINGILIARSGARESLFSLGLGQKCIRIHSFASSTMPIFQCYNVDIEMFLLANQFFSWSILYDPMTTKTLEHYKATVPQDIDGAIVRALAAAAEQQAIIDFLMQCPRSSSAKRSENYHAALFKLIKSNMLPHDVYDTILSYAKREGIHIKVHAIRRAFENAKLPIPVLLGGRQQVGGLWQVGGLFMACS